MNPNCNKTHCPGKNDHNCSASPEICHGECTEAPSDWKQDFALWWSETWNQTDGKITREMVEFVIEDLIQKKESAARKDEREQCEKALQEGMKEAVSEVEESTLRITPKYVMEKQIQAISNRKDYGR